MAPIPAVRQKRSNELSTSCQAVLRLGTSASDEGVVLVVMALLSLADSTPRAYRLKVGNASFPSSTTTGASPAANYQDPYAHALVCIKAAKKLLEIAYVHWRRPFCISYCI